MSFFLQNWLPTANCTEKVVAKNQLLKIRKRGFDYEY